MTQEKIINLLLIAAAVLLIGRALLKNPAGKTPAAQQKANAPAGYVYDYTIDGYSRVMPDGSKEYLV
jgi:hypothetical protein